MRTHRMRTLENSIMCAMLHHVTQCQKRTLKTCEYTDVLHTTNHILHTIHYTRYTTHHTLHTKYYTPYTMYLISSPHCPYMHALYACLICTPYMHALYACLICMPYMHALYVYIYTGKTWFVLWTAVS